MVKNASRKTDLYLWSRTGGRSCVTEVSLRDIRETFSFLDYSTLESLMTTDNMSDIARYIFTVMKKMDEFNVIV